MAHAQKNGSVVVQMADVEKGKSSSPAHLPSPRSPTHAFTFPTAPEKNQTFKLVVRNLTYKVKTKVKKVVEEKILLNNVTADANHSEILAIAGPSGSSKTTFLDALAGRFRSENLEGQILVNGKPMDSVFKRVSGYVMQDDNLFPLLTIRETLMFSARLRLPGNLSYTEKEERVNSLIQQLGLMESADTNVGDDQIRGVSGGERRRVSIGVDLIHDPAVLFLDEPTSGLDSTSALQVMQILSQMAITRQRTVILTIHQPSYRIIGTINRFLVLARGQVIYHGEASGMIGHFNGLGHAMPDFVNVVEYALDVIEGYHQQPKGLQQLVDAYRNSPQVKEAQQFVVESPRVVEELAGTYKKPAFATSFLSEIIVLAHRNLMNTIRTPSLFLTRIGLMISVALTMGTLFLRSKTDQKGVRQRQSFFSFTLALYFFTSVDALPLFLAEHQIFIRETSRGAYRVSTYVIAQAVVILPFLFLLATLYSSVGYFMVGLVTNAGAFFFFILILFLTLCIANAFVTFIASFVPDYATGQALCSALFANFFLFSGFYIPRSGIPKYWIWMYYLSGFTYPYEAMIENEFGHLNGVIWYDNLDSKDIKSMLLGGKVHLWIVVLAMVLFVIGYRVLFYVSLRFNTTNIQN